MSTQTHLVLALTDAERELKTGLEERIRAGLATFAEVGEALMQVRDARLYRDGYATFDEYCAGEWQIDRTRGYQLIAAARVVSTIVDTGLPAPANEAQARELAKVPEERQADVWEQTLAETNGKPTAAAVKAAATSHQEPAASVDSPSSSEPTAEEEGVAARESSSAPAATRLDEFAGWTDDERALLKELRGGLTVVVSLRGGAHDRLIRWAESAGLFVRIDRRTEWGNPFEMPADGDRDTVIANYAEHYLPYKPALLNKIETLVGKALGCWCAPEACHGDVLKEVTEQ